MTENHAYRQTAEELPTSGGSQCRGLNTHFTQSHATITDHCVVGHITIDMLPDEVLLAIFDFCVCVADGEGRWMTLIHVCRRWRYIVFASPHRLDLRLVCTDRTPVREMLDIWLALPITVRISGLCGGVPDDVVAALEHNGRVCEIYVDGISDGGVKGLATVPVMQDPFPALTHLHLDAYYETPTVPDSFNFLGGSAPRLRSLYLRDFVYPAFPKLLLSAPGLVSLSLFEGSCISSQMMVDCLASLTRLETLVIHSRPGWPGPHEGYRRPSRPPLTQRTDLPLLPVLATLTFHGATEYFDDIFTHIDAPRLEDIIMKFNDPPLLDFSRIFLFTGLKETFEALDQAHMGIKNYDYVNVILSSRSGTTGDTMFVLLIPRRNDESNWKVWWLKQDRRYPLIPLSHANFASPDVREYNPPASAVGNDQWLDLFRVFSAAKNLYLSEALAICVAPALRELVGEGVTEVLPALQNLFIINFESSGLIKDIGEFVAARDRSGHPVTVQSWIEEIRE